MKCKNCDGSGRDMFESECRFCGGMGIVEPLTNEEWFCELSTEEKAKVLFILIENIKNGESVYTAIEKAIKDKDKDVKLPPITEHLFFREWLKQPHK